MRTAFLADIHANLEALLACRADAARNGVDRIIYLGDIVGYGADPERCVDIVRTDCAAGAQAVFGNHDAAMADRTLRHNPVADAALDWTRTVLSADAKAFLRHLPLSIEDGQSLYVHASARQPQLFPYIQTAADAVKSFAACQARIIVVGHVHCPQLYTTTATAKVMAFTPVERTAVPLLQQRRWLAVMGAVGQPRDGNPAAAYGIIENNEITFHRVPYDVERAAAKIKAAGLPAALWKRLSEGR